MERLTQYEGKNQDIPMAFSKNRDKTISNSQYRHIIERLASFEDIFCDREFWIIHQVWGGLTAVCVTVKEVHNGVLEVEWKASDEYSEMIENVDVTDLYRSHEEAMKAMEGKNEIEG